MGNKFVTMGEIMLRMTRPGVQRLIQGNTFHGYYGGSEANVAVSLATMGDEVEFVTRLPENNLGHDCRNELRRYHVGTDHISWGGERLGTYFYEQAASLRSSSVSYDRDRSSMMTLSPHHLCWPEILKDARVFHWSGIACALSANCSNAVLEGLNEALRAGLYTSLDINYRKNLWNYGVKPQEVLVPAARKCHIIFGDSGEWELLTGRKMPAFRATSSDYAMDFPAYEQFLQQAQQEFPQCRHLILALRNVVSANHHLLTGMTFSDGQFYHTGIVEINPVLDQMGVGDAFIAAFLHAHFRWPGQHQQQLNYALTASALKNTVKGDFNLVSEEEVLEVAGEYYNLGLFTHP